MKRVEISAQMIFQVEAIYVTEELQHMACYAVLMQILGVGCQGPTEEDYNSGHPWKNYSPPMFDLLHASMIDFANNWQYLRKLYEIL